MHASDVRKAFEQQEMSAEEVQAILQEARVIAAAIYEWIQQQDFRSSTTTHDDKQESCDIL